MAAICGFIGCANTIIISYSTEKFISINLCGSHARYQCLLCHKFIISFMHDGNQIPENDNDSNEHTIWHFLNYHAFKLQFGNYLVSRYSKPYAINHSYHTFIHLPVSKMRLCCLSSIVINHPHFIYICPEFSISAIMNSFDISDVPEYDLINAIMDKTFSCINCGIMFESFPSKEVYATHKCNSE